MNKKNQKNKILMISSSSIGGGPKHIFLLSELIKKENIIFYAFPKYNKYFSKANYIKISERKINLRDFLTLILFIRKNSISVIHCHGKGAGVIGRILKIFLNLKLIYTFHGIHLECHNFLERYFYILYEFIFGRLDDYKVFVSKGELVYAKKHNVFIGKNFLVINNAVNNKDLRNVKNNKKKFSKNSKNFNKKNVNIISVCRLVDQKNIFEIFRIANLNKDFKFNIIGDGFLRKEAELYLKKHKIFNVEIHGNKENVFSFLYKADLFLSTSLYEGLPISILEAMSIGLPIVASNVVGNNDLIIHEQTGFLYKLGEFKIASEYIKKIINDKNLNKKISLNSFERQRSFFSTKIMKNQYLNLYQRFMR